LINFLFLARKDSESYVWAVDNLKKHVWRPQHIPKVFVTDWDSALRGALNEVFPDSQANLCTWHLNKKIITNFKKFFPASLDKATPGEILWHLHASATACVFTATPAQSTYNQRSDKLEIMVMWARLSGQHLLKSTTTNANIQRIRIVILA
jgi:hypothetical protein